VDYNLSFTAGALLYNEAKEYIDAIPDFKSYLKGEERPDYTVLSTNSDSSKKRLKSELDKRLPTLALSYLESFNRLRIQDQKCVLFLAFCKSYSIMTEFVIEVVYEKWKIFDFNLSPYDFEYFLNEKLSDERLDQITDKTKYKLAQVAIKTLRDLGMVTDTSIDPIKPSAELLQLFREEDNLWFLNCLLITNPNQLA